MTLSGYFMTENAPQKTSRREREREFCHDHLRIGL